MSTTLPPSERSSVLILFWRTATGAAGCSAVTFALFLRAAAGAAGCSAVTLAFFLRAAAGSWAGLPLGRHRHRCHGCSAAVLFGNLTT